MVVNRMAKIGCFRVPGYLPVFASMLFWVGTADAYGLPGKQQVAATPTSNMNLSELRSYFKFVYIPGGRDPLTFRERIAEKKAGKKTLDTKGVEKGTIDQGPAESEQLQKLAAWYYEIRTSIIAGSYDEAVKTATDAKKEVDKWGYVPESGYTLFGSVMRLKETARRLASREAIIREFGSMAISIDATRISSRGAAALINGQELIIEPGMRIALSEKESMQVESIHLDHIIFIYKGQRLKRPVNQIKNK